VDELRRLRPGSLGHERRSGFAVSYIYYLVAVWGVLLPHRVVLLDASGVPQKFDIDNHCFIFF